jgi:hypothetical protein
LIVAQPFDPSQLGAIEKAIAAAGSGLNPANDGKIVRIPLPSLTEERRKELSKHVHKLSEEGRNSVRQVRRDANERLKKAAQRSQDLGRRREEGARRGPEDHRQPHQADRRPAEEEGLGASREVSRSLKCEVSKSDGTTSTHFRLPILQTSDFRLLPTFMSLFSHLECSVPCGARYAIRGNGTSSAPAARHCWRGYDLDRRARWSRDTLQRPRATMWRYREMCRSTTANRR